MKKLRKEIKVMRVFISQPMHGKSTKEIEDMRDLAIKTIKANYPNEPIEIVNNFFHDDAPEDAGRLWHLGRSIQELDNVDAITFTPDWKNANGCLVERAIADLYGIKII